MTSDNEVSTVFWLALALLLFLVALVYTMLRPRPTISAAQLAEAEEDWARLKPQNQARAREIYREVTR